MDKKTKQKWVKALRSGKYQQGEGSLRKTSSCFTGGEEDKEENKFCCLGVLCDIVEPKKWKLMTPGGDHWMNGNAPNIGFPRDELQAKLGLDKLDKRSDTETVAQKLAIMNDDGKSFNVIADWIEKHF